MRRVVTVPRARQDAPAAIAAFDPYRIVELRRRRRLNQTQSQHIDRAVAT
jgi:hypothetical protein